MSSLYSSTLTMNAVGAITLTLLNILAAGVVICLGFLDNRHSGKKTLNLRPERRTPVYLAIAIFLSNLLFCVREIKEMQGMDNGEVEVQGTSDCIAVNQVTWWGVWLPLSIITVRVFCMAGGVIFRYNPWCRRNEVIYLLICIPFSFLLWIPSYVSNPAPCSAFVMRFSPTDNSALGRAGLVILIVFFLLISISAIIVGWHATRPQRRHHRFIESEIATIESRAGSEDESNPGQRNRATLTSFYYCLGLFLQYICLSPNFAMVLTGQQSDAGIYLASTVIHTTGIILLLQYLFMRNPTCPHCHTSMLPAPITGSTERKSGRRGLLKPKFTPATSQRNSRNNSNSTELPKSSGIATVTSVENLLPPHRLSNAFEVPSRPSMEETRRPSGSEYQRPVQIQDFMKPGSSSSKFTPSSSRQTPVPAEDRFQSLDAVSPTRSRDSFTHPAGDRCSSQTAAAAKPIGFVPTPNTSRPTQPGKLGGVSGIRPSSSRPPSYHPTPIPNRPSTSPLYSTAPSPKSTPSPKRWSNDPKGYAAAAGYTSFNPTRQMDSLNSEAPSPMSYEKTTMEESVPVDLQSTVAEDGSFRTVTPAPVAPLNFNNKYQEPRGL